MSSNNHHNFHEKYQVFVAYSGRSYTIRNNFWVLSSADIAFDPLNPLSPV
jgi:hypothetical protein